jgi:branched-chain amino acid aminotransferase
VKPADRGAFPWGKQSRFIKQKTKEENIMSTKQQYIWMDGKMLEAEKATVPFMNSALHYGTGVFEGIRAYNTDKGPAVFRLKEHMQRLLDSAKIMGFRKVSFTVDELCQAVVDTVAANKVDQCYIRPLIYSGGPTMSLNLDDTEAKVGICTWAMGVYLGEEALEAGIRANVSSFTRHHPNVTMTKAKSTGNYTNSIMTKTDSVRLGFEEAIMLDPQGYVSECTGENLFTVRGGKVVTPFTAAVLEGITRDSILTLCADLGIGVVEQPISRDQLYLSDEMFVCGTAAEVIALREVDFRTIGSGKMGPITRKIQKAFHEAATGTGPRSAEWLTYVKAG